MNLKISLYVLVNKMFNVNVNRCNECFFKQIYHKLLLYDILK